MHLISYDLVDPLKAATETRSASVRGRPDLPNGDYGFLEAYCSEPTCHCRRVMINVAGRSQGRILASVSYGFDRQGEFPGPMLDPLNPQSEYAPALLRLVTEILADPAYVARLEAHYYQVKGATADPQHPVHARLEQAPSGGASRSPIRRLERKRKRR